MQVHAHNCRAATTQKLHGCMNARCCNACIGASSPECMGVCLPHACVHGETISHCISCMPSISCTQHHAVPCRAKVCHHEPCSGPGCMHAAHPYTNSPTHQNQRWPPTPKETTRCCMSVRGTIAVACSVHASACIYASSACVPWPCTLRPQRRPRQNK